jgi:hypothetical protein
LGKRIKARFLKTGIYTCFVILEQAFIPVYCGVTGIRFFVSEKIGILEKLKKQLPYEKLFNNCATSLYHCVGHTALLCQPRKM